MDFNQFKDMLMLGLASGGIYILKGLKESVEKLTIEIAVGVERMDNHEKRIDKLEARP